MYKSFCGNMCQEWKRIYIFCCKCKKRLCKVCLIKFGEKYYCNDCIVINIDLKKYINNK